MKPTIFVVSQQWYLKPFADLFREVDNIRDADVIMFTGGSDVSPNFYQEKMGRYTQSDFYRDQIEASHFQWGIKNQRKFLGICRGSQFLTVMSGGRLVQHVTNHGGEHIIFTKEGREVFVSSTHHQMMNPFGMDLLDYELLGWAEGESSTYLNGEGGEIPIFQKNGIEPEVVWYPKSRALAIQAHPEIMRPDSKGVEYFRGLVEKHLI